MKKKDLKSGMIVKTYNGMYYLVLLDTGMKLSDLTDKDVLVGIDENGGIEKNGWMKLSEYNDNLEHEDTNWIIKEVLSVKYSDDIGRIRRYKRIWSRCESVDKLN